MHAQILKYFIDNGLISDCQFVFLLGKSTHEAIFKTTHHVYSAINNNNVMGMLLLDVAKAFNCIDHEILFKKMDMAGFGPMVLIWFRSYINRTQQVIIQSKISDVVPVGTGIAQGTVLGVILFIFYINDIIYAVNHVKMRMFADDCILYYSGNNWPVVNRIIQADFDKVVDWTFRNSLRLNYNKTKAMIFGTQNKLSKLVDHEHFKIGNHIIDFVHNYVYLGVIIDDVMSLNPLINNLKKRISNKVFMLRKIRKFLIFDAAVLV